MLICTVFLVLVVLLRRALAAWQTVFDANLTVTYVKTVNGTIYELPIMSEAVEAQSLSKQLRRIADAPRDKFSLAVDNSGRLLAIYGAGDCGVSPITISWYDKPTNKWRSLASSSDNWYNQGSVVWIDRSLNALYIYGGECNGNIVNSFYSYDIARDKFDTVDVHPRPREMAYSQALELDGHSTIIIGGRANSGWLSMQQIAFWEYGSWSYRSAYGSEGIDSRDNPLLLPMWYKLSPSVGTNTVLPSKKIIVAGGQVDGRDARPSVAVLAFNNSEGWGWRKTDIVLNAGATAFYQTLVNIRLDSQNGAGPQIQLFNAEESFKSAKSASVPQYTPPSIVVKKGGMSTGGVVTMSTVLPILAVGIAAVSLYLWWRRRCQNRTFQPRSSRLDMDSMIARDKSSEWPNSETLEEKSIEDFRDLGRCNDVQILVSNRRHSLRVVNPDNESDLVSLSTLSRYPTSKQHTRVESASSSVEITSPQNPFSAPEEDSDVSDEGAEARKSCSRRKCPQ